MKIKLLLALAGATTLVACAVRPVAGEPVLYRLPDAPAGGSRLLRSVTVLGASWLAGPDMRYRLDYRDRERVAAFGQSRWQASPAEMLERYLGRSLTGNGGVGACRLRLELDGFEQVFDRVDASHALLEARVTLLAAGGAPLARQSFRMARSAATPDAGGGAAALGLAAGELSQALARWLDGLNPGECRRDSRG